MTAKELEKKVLEKAIEFGLFTQKMKDAGGKKPGGPNAVVRSNLNTFNLPNPECYFGYIRPEEDIKNAYHDLSFVIFPQENKGKCVVSIGVGSAGFQRDYDLVSTAGTRRLFTRLTQPDGNSFIKNDFTDIDNPIIELHDRIANDEGLQDLMSVINQYNKLNKAVLLASRIVDPDTEEGFKVIVAWLAQYAKLRNWGTNKDQRDKQNLAISSCDNKKTIDIQKDIENLLNSKRFVVLQGAPGTGKTYNAVKISKKYEQTHFIQFHAETTYADFVEGIRPKLDGENIGYIREYGILVKAIEAAQELENTGGRVLLIIDEINRANLANVLGPVFYLFENQADIRKVKIKIGEHELEKLPDNLNVIATMNTADRSLAVVDFALRRRFAWYTLRPQKIEPDSNQEFHKELFDRFCEIFDRYASDEELNLQPGPSYFLTPKENSKDIMKERMIYELLPLIKEYLAEGLMKKAADSFAQLFYEETDKYLYE